MDKEEVRQQIALTEATNSRCITAEQGIKGNKQDKKKKKKNMPMVKNHRKSSKAGVANCSSVKCVQGVNKAATIGVKFTLAKPSKAQLANSTKSTRNPECPEDVREAKRINRRIEQAVEMGDISNVPLPEEWENDKNLGSESESHFRLPPHGTS
ncbi:uncharacterized protein LAESUDRAFT_760371 [Laetiporus sulphureus 93-53]|uniref:Uncharacterized protein n=1 Tax=Laetiporus sulphureus 93-53 TaxID=1314785 RepID=A0A165DM92_9APHY|nr:uncharacterized protein LAESUDRAFT_760371 [Laetiporus sulphureus 93-53]KZT05187.1 hypothetical protein LAESUDRAFT_760371 [Laetiporus sulphureus 93-53]